MQVIRNQYSKMYGFRKSEKSEKTGVGVIGDNRFLKAWNKKTVGRFRKYHHYWVDFPDYLRVYPGPIEMHDFAALNPNLTPPSKSSYGFLAP